MQMNYKQSLDDMVHSYIYKSSILFDEQRELIEKIKTYLSDSSYIEKLRELFSGKTASTTIGYNYFLYLLLEDCPTQISISILLNQEDYDDLFTSHSFFIQIWEQLPYDEKINYLKKKKKFTALDARLISILINDAVYSKKFYKELKNKEILKKIESHVIDVPIKLFSIEDMDFGRIVLQKNYTKALLEKISSFNKFIDLVNNNPNIFTYIENHSLYFKPSFNDDIYSFLLENSSYIGKFQTSYLQLFSIKEIKKLLKNVDEPVAYSTLLNQLFIYDKENISSYITEENLKKCAKYSLSFAPFAFLEKKLSMIIFNNYKLLNRFMDSVLIQAINDYFKEEDIVNLLRNDSFIAETSSYAIELILNKLSFASTFNMLQRKNILEKIEHLNVNVCSRDFLFIKGFLDSPNLVVKSDHSMLYAMLSLFDAQDVSYYLFLPYIVNALSEEEIINLLLEKDISIEPFLEIPSFVQKFESVDLICYVDKYLKKNGSLDLLKNKILNSILFSPMNTDNIDFSEVNYLYETIRMKDILSRQEIEVSLESYTSVLASYLVLGLEGTLQIINDGNKSISLEKIFKIEKQVISFKLLKFKNENSLLFKNAQKEVSKNLLSIENCENADDFYELCLSNDYLNNVIKLMLRVGYQKNIIKENFYNFITLQKKDYYKALEELYTFIHTFLKMVLEDEKNKYIKEFEENILNHFKLKDSIIYKKQKILAEEYFVKLKIKILVRALTNVDKGEYIPYFVDNFEINKIKELYSEQLAKVPIDFKNILEHILIPLANERFSNENCLNQLNIFKPYNYDAYQNYLNDLKLLTELNTIIRTWKGEYNETDLLTLLNSILYLTPTPLRLKKRRKKDVEKCQNLVNQIYHIIYIDKTDLLFHYEEEPDFYNMDELTEYRRYNAILNKIIKKTFSFVKKYMREDILKINYREQYFASINIENYKMPINVNNYELRRRVFSIKDLMELFKGFSFENIPTNKNEILAIQDKIVMLSEGYYKGIINNAGFLFANWDSLSEYFKSLSKDICSMSLLDIEEVLQIETFKNNTFATLIDKNLLASLYEQNAYIIDLNKRIEILETLYIDSYKRICLAIPFVSIKDDDLEIKVIDSYSHDDLYSFKNDLYKIGSVGNDFFEYTILNKNGFQIGIYDKGMMIGKILGCRNGNAIYLNGYNGEQNSKINDLLKCFANLLLDKTKKSKEPLSYVFLVNNSQLSYPHDPMIDESIISWINYPIYSKKQEYYNDEKMFTSYKNSTTTVLASSELVDKQNIKYYEAEAIYDRKRNMPMILTGAMDNSKLNRIKIFLYIMKDDLPNISNYERIYLGDDYFVGIGKEVKKRILPFDKRAKKEIEDLLK